MRTSFAGNVVNWAMPIMVRFPFFIGTEETNPWCEQQLLSHTAASHMQWVLVNTEPWYSELWPSPCPTRFLMNLQRSQPWDTWVSWKLCKHLPRRGKCTHIKNFTDFRDKVHLNYDANTHFLRRFKTISLSPFQVILQSSESILIALTGNLKMHSLFTFLPAPSMKHAALYTQMYHNNSKKFSLLILPGQHDD